MQLQQRPVICQRLSSSCLSLITKEILYIPSQGEDLSPNSHETRWCHLLLEGSHQSGLIPWEFEAGKGKGKEKEKKKTALKQIAEDREYFQNAEEII